MGRFIIRRHGCNAANQHMTPTKVLGTVEAKDVEEAKAKAAQEWSCYANQHFSAIDYDDGHVAAPYRKLADTQDALGHQEW